MKKRITITVLILGLMLVGVIGAGVGNIPNKDESWELDLPQNKLDALAPYRTKNADYWDGSQCLEMNDGEKLHCPYYYNFNGTAKVAWRYPYQRYSLVSKYCDGYYDEQDQEVLDGLRFVGECKEAQRTYEEQMVLGMKKHEAQIWDSIYNAIVSPPVKTPADVGTKTTT